MKERADVLRHFDAAFIESSVASAEDLKEAFRLRYLVYCVDRGFEDTDDCPSGLEHDEYDDRAEHCLLKARASRRALGTVRVVTTAGSVPTVESLPLAAYAPKESMEILQSMPGATTGEVSRFAIIRSARDILRQSAETVEGDAQGRLQQLLPYMALGLFRSIVRLSVRRGLTHWCLAAEPSLLRRLRSLGLHFQPAGPLVDHRGLRQICYTEITTLLSRLEAERPEVWDVLTLGGHLLADEPVRTVA